MDSYGDTTGEYLEVRHGAALVEGEHELVWASGRDSVGFLQDILSQELEERPVGDVSRSFLLSPQGKLRSLLWVMRGDEEVGMLTDAGTAQTVVSDLERLRIRVDVQLETDERPVLELWGPHAERVLQTASLPTPNGWARHEGALVVSLSLGGLPRFVIAGLAGSFLEQAGARRVGRLASTAVRIEAGEPRMGWDVDEKTIPQETGLVPEAVSFDKGCYLGQELVARIEARGHVNRVLRGVALAQNVFPPSGAEVVSGDRVVGTVGSVGESLTLRAPVALALLRREVPPGSDVEVRWVTGSARGVVRLLPLDDFMHG